MEFTQKYSLIELLAGDGVQSYRAVQNSTGREVAVHLLVGGKTPENEALLARLRAMQPQSMAKLIEVGEERDNTYVVTVAPPYQRLDEWLAEQDRVAGLAHDFARAGFWKRPEAGSPAAPPAPLPGVPPFAVGTPGSEPGAFTRMFQSPVAPPPVPGVPPSRPVAPSSSEPGAFARMFQSPVTPPTPVPGVPPVAAGTPTPEPPPPPSRPVAPSPSEPGAFTRMFQSPVTPPTPAPGVPPVAAGTPTPEPPPPPSRPVAPSPSEPGALTRM